MVSSTENAESASTTPRRLPGIEGVWVFVGADSVMFALLFGSFMYYRGLDPAAFEVGRQTLDRNFGGINTLILLTSSWFVVLAVHAAKNHELRAVPRWLAGGIVCGVLFMISKVVEYVSKISGGLPDAARDFYMYYFSMTGLHLAHVIGGTVVLIVMWRRARAQAYAGENVERLEAGATFWHMVDYLWIVIFPLLYLLR